MNECPQGTCDGVEKIKENMITKKWFMWIIGFLILFLVGIVGAVGKTQIDVAKVKTHYEHIQEDTKEIKSSVKNIYKILKKKHQNNNDDE